MLCESCGKDDANVHLTHVADDVAREMHLCEKCAAKHGINIEGPMSLTSMFSGQGVPGEKEPDLSGKACPLCRMTLNDFRKTSLLGCSECYGAFAEELAPVIAGMHKGDRHVGKVPSRFKDGQGVDKTAAPLRKRLESAVAAEDFEEAARLRDVIRAEEGGGRSGQEKHR